MNLIENFNQLTFSITENSFLYFFSSKIHISSDQIINLIQHLKSMIYFNLLNLETCWPFFDEFPLTNKNVDYQLRMIFNLNRPHNLTNFGIILHQYSFFLPVILSEKSLGDPNCSISM